MGAPISGKSGSVSCGGAVADVINWKATLEADNKVYASSDTAGYKKTVGGVTKWSGSFDFLLDDADPNNAPSEGTIAVLSLLSTSGSGIAGSAAIDSVELDVDVGGGDIIKGTCQFTGINTTALPMELT